MLWDGAPVQVEDYLSTDDLDALCEIESPIDAATALLSHFALVHAVYPIHTPGRSEFTLFLLVFPDHRCSWFQMYEMDVRRWTDAINGSDRQRQILTETLSWVQAPAPIEKLLSDLHLDARPFVPSRRVKTDALLDLWWHTRFAEGCDARSARMLLGLTVSAALWQALDFPADGGAPTALISSG